MKRMLLAVAFCLLVPSAAAADDVLYVVNMCRGKTAWAEVQGGQASEQIPYGEREDFEVVFAPGAQAGDSVAVVLVYADAASPGGGKGKAGSVIVEYSRPSRWDIRLESEGGRCKLSLVGRALAP